MDDGRNGRRQDGGVQRRQLIGMAACGGVVTLLSNRGNWTQERPVSPANPYVVSDFANAVIAAKLSSVCPISRSIFPQGAVFSFAASV